MIVGLLVSGKRRQREDGVAVMVPDERWKSETLVDRIHCELAREIPSGHVV